MKLRTCVRVLIAVSFATLGLVDTLSATGLVVELSPDGRWGPGVYTLAVSGPLQIICAAMLAFGRRTRAVLNILGCYVFLTLVLGNLPLIFKPQVGVYAIAGVIGNLAVLGGILFWFHNDRISSAPWTKHALPMANPAPAREASPLVFQDSSRRGYLSHGD